MPFDSKAVANQFLTLAKNEGKSLTPMQLIKLVYFAHGWYLAITGTPLLNETVQAWKFGPVIPSLYHEFKRFGNSPITERATKTDIIGEGGTLKLRLQAPEITGEGSVLAKRVIEKVWEKYKHYSAVQLSNLTHLPDSPWAKTKGREIKGTVIPDDTIRQYYLALTNK